MSASARPNILWYCTDQQRFDTIGALGNPHVQTPVLDELVRTGTAFTHAFCQSPICTPSRSSFMTGQYPSRVRNTRNGNDTFANHPPLLSRQLADTGYHCGMVGKFHLQSSGRRTEPRMDDGFSWWKFSHAPRDDWEEGHDYAEWVKERGGDLDAMRESDDRIPAEFHQTTWTTERALEFLDEAAAQEKPWMLNLNPYDPHPPFIPPRAYADRFDPELMPGPSFEERDLAAQQALASVDFQTKSRRPEEFDGKGVQARYYAMIALIDEQFGRLVEYLDRTGQRENTVIVFTSDHGEALGDHGLLLKGCRFYEGLVRVPLIFNCPGRIAENMQSEALVELLDMSATLLDYAGLERPAPFQGESLRPILSAQAPAHEHRTGVRSEYFDALDGSFLQAGGDASFATMYRTRTHKLVVYHKEGLGELFDLDNDPWEHNNLWDDPAAMSIKSELILESFNSHVVKTTDVGSERIAPM